MKSFIFLAAAVFVFSALYHSGTGSTESKQVIETKHRIQQAIDARRTADAERATTASRLSLVQ